MQQLESVAEIKNFFRRLVDDNTIQGQNMLKTIYDLARCQARNEESISFMTDSFVNDRSYELLKPVVISKALSIAIAMDKNTDKMNFVFIPFVKKERLPCFSETFFESVIVGICTLYNHQSAAPYICRMIEANVKDMWFSTQVI